MQEFCIENIDEIAEKILMEIRAHNEKATVVTFAGDFGAGKTTLTQAIGKKLGIKENMISPTFIIMKRYPLSGQTFATLIHIDAYRLSNGEELARLRFGEYLLEPRTLIIIEWPERVASILPKDVVAYTIEHSAKDKRTITL